MYLYVGIGLVVVIAAVIAFIATRSESFHIERSAQIQAPADIAFSLVNDLHQWARWSPFEKLDPDMKKSFDGPPTGPGASYAWSGNNKAGEGRMTILETQPNKIISIKLEFFRPFKAVNDAAFHFVPGTDGTKVTWGIDGKKNFMMKLAHLFMNMDKMLGGQFDEGLSNLNRVAQEEAGKSK
jgi:hypothetical protein